MTHPIIAGNRYFSLATYGAINVWVAPLAYVYNENEGVFYFYSCVESKHMRHIAENQKVALCIYDSTASSDRANGLQIEAQAEILEHNIDDVCRLYFEQSFPNQEERQKWQQPVGAFQGEAMHRFVKVSPMNAYINDVKNSVDYRKEIKL